MRAEAWPDAENADELHDALVWLGFLTADEARSESRLERLACRACRAEARGAVACARSDPLDLRRARAAVPALWPRARLAPALAAPADNAGLDCSRDDALVEIVRGRLEGSGPVAGHALAAAAWPDRGDIAARARRRSSTEGFVHARAVHAGAVRRRMVRAAAACRAFTTTRSSDCARRSSRSRHATSCASCSPGSMSAADARMAGPKALDAVVAQLEGFEAPAGAWESEILPARLAGLRARRGSTTGAWPDMSHGCGCSPPGPTAVIAGHRRCERRRSPCCRALMRRLGHRCRRKGASDPSRPTGASGRRLHHGARRVVLRRAGGGQRPLAVPGRGGACRAGRARTCDLRQFRRLAGAAGAVARAQAACRRKATPAHRNVRHGGSGPLGAGPRPRPQQAESDRRSRGGRACRAHAAAAVTASCSGGCSSARPTGCRHGGSCCASIARSSGAARFAAAASSPGSPASSSPCPTRSECCGKLGASRQAVP